MRAVVLICLAACGGSSAPPEPAPGCNPLIGDDCLTPFPSAFYETDDASSATGVRVAIPDGVLPEPRSGTALTPARLNRHDGVSPASPFVVYFKAGVDPTQLPSPWVAAGSSFIAFTLGAILPVLPYLLGATTAVLSTIVAALTLFAAGVIASRFTSRSWWYAGLRQLAFGMLAALVTYGVGALFHVTTA